MKSALSVFALLSLVACDKLKGTAKEDPSASQTPSAKPSASAAAVAAPIQSGAPQNSATPAETPKPPPSCKLLAQKIWGKGVNKTTGLTADPLPDKRVAVGFAYGNTPHVMLVGQKGDGKVSRVAVKEGTPFAATPKDAVRELVRVSPAAVTDTGAEAHIDFRDTYKDGRRHVSCGPALGAKPLLSFEGKSVVDKGKIAKAKAEEATFHSESGHEGNVYAELRDCRSMYVDGNTFAVGSELFGEKDKEGKIKWKSRLLIANGGETKPFSIYQSDLKGDEPYALQYEVPVADSLRSGYLLAVRFSGTLLAAPLNRQKNLAAPFQMYPGFPTLVDLAQDGNQMVLMTSFTKGKDAKGNSEYLLRAARVDLDKPELPKALTNVKIDDDDGDSEVDPEFTVDAHGQRWLAYIDGERGSGHLMVLPIDSAFRAVGKPYAVTEGDERASEARLIPLSSGGLVAVYIREMKGTAGTELVTEDLDCEIVKP